MGLFH